MVVTILTMFPQILGSADQAPVTARCIRDGRLELEIRDIRDYAPGSFRRIDDSPYGGGPGMILRCQPVLDALQAARRPSGRICCAALTPSGRRYSQEDARRFADLDQLILLCGHYEGMDERIYRFADEEISIGDYILTGGEPAALAILDSVVRLLPGALRQESTQTESFEGGRLEYPQYTRPAEYAGEKVPKVLLSGDHEAIRRWRIRQSLERTARRRPDLLERFPMTAEERAIWEEGDRQ